MKPISNKSSKIDFNINYKTKYGKSLYLVIWCKNLSYSDPIYLTRMDVLHKPNSFNNYTNQYGESKWSASTELNLHTLKKLAEKKEELTYNYFINYTDAEDPLLNATCRTFDQAIKASDLLSKYIFIDIYIYIYI